MSDVSKITIQQFCRFLFYKSVNAGSINSKCHNIENNLMDYITTTREDYKTVIYTCIYKYAVSVCMVRNTQWSLYVHHFSLAIYQK